MSVVALINPNTSRPTTDMMAGIARRTLRPEDGFEVRGVTVAEGPSMLVQENVLRAAGPHVVAAARQLLSGPDGERIAALVVSAFGDPGIEQLRAVAPVPVVGIAEAAMAEAAEGGRRFGIATTTPGLARAIDARVELLGHASQYTGIRLTPGDPHELAATPEVMRERLAEAVEACVTEDGAQAVIIGGGPLGEAAEALQGRFPVPVIGPIPAACREVRRVLAAASVGGVKEAARRTA
ncbi:aspartate/glutamate racemase family protein [Streptomyces sp. NPDC046821]|uniref:aspartate/glutamate racemase family protein n=1 Tax=Streptomyces sp. NPDC046821 TaxID=3154702 RepID=UPI0033E9D909